jgi:hypothetical protein
MAPFSSALDNAVLAAATMNFHKLLGAFWRIFLSRLLVMWNRLHSLQAHQADKIQYQYAGYRLFQD